jgi:predicted Rossmann fold flavoprotein
MSTKTYDTIVIGGGPAGMMAAGRAGERGQSVLLLEKNSKLGKKLLISGGGRCNLTNNKDNQSLVRSYKGNPKALNSLFARFNVEDTLNFFKSRGLDTKEEEYGRMFPITDKAESVWEVLKTYVEDSNVEILYDSSVIGISKNDMITVQTNVESYQCKSCIVAVGGLSRPETGSTGDGYIWLEQLGHTIIDNRLALVPLATQEEWPHTISGVSLDHIRLSIWQNRKKISSYNGKILFTHFGVSGPTILNMSSEIGGLLQNDKVSIEIDLRPDLDYAELKEAFNTLLQKESNKSIKNSLPKLIQSSISKVLLEIVNIEPSTPNHSIKKEDRKALMKLIKSLPLSIKGLMGADKAVVSAGGIRLEDINITTMESNITKGIYIVGDLLNVDRPSGGYSLQLCWSTGYVAGDNS